MQTAATCNVCHGTGQSITRKPSGTDEMGMVREEAVVSLDIPGGVEDGMQLSVRGEGNGAPMGGVAGDLIVMVEVLPHDTFQRNGKNLHHDHYITFVDAALGVHVRGAPFGRQGQDQNRRWHAERQDCAAARQGHCPPWTATATATS
jgi:molecular chaperone DnaJ